MITMEKNGVTHDVAEKDKERFESAGWTVKKEKEPKAKE